ncbi:YopX family protein [Liquorilactobacillus mali]|uniref:YopX family protein n=1 Tax=Liquorilactobacillus mali TaxID=1618 RepID=UPI002655EF58|nr:YopX family protein [Liquorilactobacillus mali]MDN7144419.1 YopX family protein [Liquorilactobacillus mali]
MREIKFRAWHEDSKRYKYMSIESFNFGSFIGLVDDLDWNNVAIWEQYTGLKDNNGKEIYEGDIIKYYGSNKRVKVKTAYGIVFYDSEHGCFNSRIQNGEHNKGGINPGDDLVVGNIHENADLLEVSE